MPEVIQVNIVENTTSPTSEIIDKGTTISPIIKNNREVFQSVISEKGTKGNPGESYNGDNVRSMIAGEVISSGMAVIVRSGKVYKFDPMDESLYGKQIGIAVTSSSNVGEDINVQLDGIVHIPGWGLTPDTLYYIGNNSLPTIFSNMKLVVVLGVAISSDKLKLNFLTQVITE